MLMIQTMFLCAGLGTRLQPLTNELPKPLVPIGDRPVLGHLMERLAAQGGRLRAVNTHHRPEKIQHYIGGLGDDVHVSHERELLGTAGGVSAAVDAFAPSPLVVWNADILTNPPVGALAQLACQAELALLFEPAAVGAGNVGVDGAGRIVRLRTARIATEMAGGYYVGILAMNPRCFQALPARGCLIGDVAIPLMQSGAILRGVRHEAPWSDVGSLGAYLDENLKWLGERVAWVDATARVAPDIALESSLVGAGATVVGSGKLERVVVWPGARCVAPLADAIVTPVAGVVRLPRA